MSFGGLPSFFSDTKEYDKLYNGHMLAVMSTFLCKLAITQGQKCNVFNETFTNFKKKNQSFLMSYGPLFTQVAYHAPKTIELFTIFILELFVFESKESTFFVNSNNLSFSNLELQNSLSHCILVYHKGSVTIQKYVQWVWHSFLWIQAPCL